MDNSILNSIKKLLGILSDDTSFDVDILMHINTVLTILRQVGMVIPNGFTVEDVTQQWSDILGSNLDLNLVRSYVFTQVKLLFDPPTSSFGLAAMQQQATMLEWRIYTLVDIPFEYPATATEE